MMKARKNRQGFTTVELVIVIAVIGILTAILIPTFFGLTENANRASDQSLVSNLNVGLKLQEIEDGNTNTTMHDAIEDLKKQGYSLNQLFTKSRSNLLWDSETNQFELESNQNNSRYWKIFDKAPSMNNKYSIYIRTPWSNSISIQDVGLDVGYTTNVTSISYGTSGNSSDVLIRTNSFDCDLTIDAITDSVRHYGPIKSVNIIAVKLSSYHEYGLTPFVSVATGRVVLEKSAKVEALHVKSSSAIFGTVLEEQLPFISIEESITAFAVQITKENKGEVINAAVVAVGIGGTISLTSDISVISDSRVLETKAESEARDYAIANSELIK